MKIKLKLSLLVIGIMAAVITAISVLLLHEASDISRELSLKSIRNLTGQRVEYWKGREEGLLNILRTLSNVMSTYEEIDADERRDMFDDILRATISTQPIMISLYTIWKPNAIDGMDEHFIGRTGSSPTGQYAIIYTKESGQLESRTSIDIDDTMAYLNGQASRRDRVDPPYASVVNGKNTHVFRMMVPIINPDTDEIVGGVGCLFTIDAMQGTIKQVVDANDEITIMAIYANTGFIFAHVYPDRIGRFMQDADAEFGDLRQTMLSAIKTGNSFEGSIYDPNFDTDIELTLRSFQIGSSDMTWSILIGTTESYIMEDVNRMTKFTVILALISIIAAAAVVFLVLGYITKPIITVTNTLKDISEGEGDLTRTIPGKGNDEIAELSRYFNKTLDKIKNLIINIKEQAGTLSQTGADLSSNMTETAAAINEITANIQSIKNRVNTQSNSVTETNEDMEQITVNIQKLSKHVEDQTASVTQSSSAIEEMLANIQSVTNTLNQNSANVSSLISASNTGRSDLEKVASDIQEIARESVGLLQINAAMNDIAAQTNLLSMNAAIEAAHAGEAGKGFAVVADEIRKLAESSAEQSKTTGNVLKKIKDSIDNISESTANVLARFEAIDSGVKTVSAQEEHILNAMEEQNKGSRQILEAISALNTITQQVNSGSHEMLDNSNSVINETKNLEMITQEITGGMNEMASGADQINVAVTKVNEISLKNRENIDYLVKEVSRFKVA